MTKTLYVDVATNDRWLFASGASDDVQPYMVRLSWLLEADNSSTLAEACHLVRLPVDLRMADEAAFVTGIMDHALQARGISLDAVMTEFAAQLEQAQRVVAFGWEARRKILERSYRLLNRHTPTWPESGCAMIEATNVVKIPRQAPGGGYKWPSFDQACERCFGQSLMPSMDSVADGLKRVRAVRVIWSHVRRTA